MCRATLAESASVPLAIVARVARSASETCWNSPRARIATICILSSVPSDLANLVMSLNNLLTASWWFAAAFPNLAKASTAAPRMSTSSLCNKGSNNEIWSCGALHCWGNLSTMLRRFSKSTSAVTVFVVVRFLVVRRAFSFPSANSVVKPFRKRGASLSRPCANLAAGIALMALLLGSMSLAANESTVFIGFKRCFSCCPAGTTSVAPSWVLRRIRAFASAVPPTAPPALASLGERPFPGGTARTASSATFGVLLRSTGTVFSLTTGLLISLSSFAKSLCSWSALPMAFGMRTLLGGPAVIASPAKFVFLSRRTAMVCSLHTSKPPSSPLDSGVSSQSPSTSPF
mmetsp:Transcript_72422/g.209673  ORF Transcript_72422/g.209673 Transcript_72422/m.209673 type:complete len:344 (-) Transcript_72422:2623-3654(-)